MAYVGRACSRETAADLATLRGPPAPCADSARMLSRPRAAAARARKHANAPPVRWAGLVAAAAAAARRTGSPYQRSMTRCEISRIRRRGRPAAARCRTSALPPASASTAALPTLLWRRRAHVHHEPQVLSSFARKTSLWRKDYHRPVPNLSPRRCSGRMMAAPGTTQRH